MMTTRQFAGSLKRSLHRFLGQQIIEASETVTTETGDQMLGVLSEGTNRPAEFDIRTEEGEVFRVVVFKIPGMLVEQMAHTTRRERRRVRQST